MSRFTILGATGTIGQALTWHLLREGHDVQPVDRRTLPHFLDTATPAGHVIDCIGLTGDFRTRTLETAEAHVGITAACLRRPGWKSFLFLSSTRVYGAATNTHEDARLTVDPNDPYNMTKLAGEALCLSDARHGVRVARLSNVIAGQADSTTFLGQLLVEGQSTGQVTFRQAADSTKDYIALEDVVRLLPAIATRGRYRRYNLASGHNTSHASVAETLTDRFGWLTKFIPNAPSVRFPPISTLRLREEFGCVLSEFSEAFARMAARQEAAC
jgi:nucleoside-diphosphate-sugar epimerase